MADRFATMMILACAVGTALSAEAQTTMRPTPPPTVVADREAWYVSQGPLAFGGGIYYPSGPTIHFIANEMVEVGAFDRVTIYARTTLEPKSVVYVPLEGGLMRPYERLRTGDLAGTVGSTSPGFVVAQPTDSAVDPGTFPHTPVGTSGFLIARSATPTTSAAAAQPARASARTSTEPDFPAHPQLRSAEKPTGLNGVYIQFKDARWFADGPAVSFTPERFARVGEYRGYGVYAERGHPERIYVALFQGQPGLISPYRRR